MFSVTFPSSGAIPALPAYHRVAQKLENLILKITATINEFKTRLKTHLLIKNYACFVWTIVMRSRVYYYSSCGLDKFLIIIIIISWT